MPPSVVNGALLSCTGAFVPAPVPFVALPTSRVMAGGMPAGDIMSNVPIVNIPTFGACKLPSNPAVAAATAAALGVLTPMPCVPVTPAPWIPSGAPTVMAGGKPALTASCKLMCVYGGQISVVNPGQVTVQSG
jgi:hypothetical protein